MLAALTLGATTSEAPLERLRRAKRASAGLSIALRTATGRLQGRLHLYSVLNADAARAVRRGQPEVAAALAERAAEVENSAAMRHIVAAVTEAFRALPLDVHSPTPDDHYGQVVRRYVAMRRAARLDAEVDVLIREWLSRASAWILASPEPVLCEAILDAARMTEEARRIVLAHGSVDATTYVGVVTRLDPVAAELESESGERWLLPRRDLEREGLALVGHAAALIREELIHGPTVWVTGPATRVDCTDADLAEYEYDVFDTAPDGFDGVVVGKADLAWRARQIAADPVAIPVSPIPLQDDD